MNDYSLALGLTRDYQVAMRPCEICENEDFAVFQEYGRVGEPGIYGRYPIHICQVCGFKMANPRLEDDFYRDYYQQLYREVAFGALVPSDDYIDQQEKRGKSVLEFVANYGVAPGRMLDIGCASGATMLPWIADGWSCKGVDPHMPSVETARTELGLEVHLGSGEELPFTDKSFELCLALGPIEHAYNVELMFNEIRRTLVDSGYLVIRWRSSEIFGSPLEYYNHNHYRFFTPNSWSLLLRKYGFSTLSTTTKKLEGWNSYEYILARKDLEPSRSAVHEMIRNGVKDDPQTELARIAKLRQEYFELCKEFLEFAKRVEGDEKAIVEAVRRGEIRWTFLTDVRNLQVPRSLLEAERYVASYMDGEVR